MDQGSVRVMPFGGARWEYKAIAAIYRALFDEGEVSDYEARESEEWRQSDGGFDRGRYALVRLLASDEEGEVLGYAQGYQTPWAFDPRRYHIAVRVHPDWQRRGVGRALHDALLAELRSRGATTLRAEVYADHEGGVAFAEHLGWGELFRSCQYTLNLWRFDPTPFQPLLDRLAAEGITITTVNEEARGGTGWLPKLYALHNSLRADLPIGEGYTPMGIERFAQLVGGREESLPDAFFIAKRGDDYLGESYLQRGEQPDALEQKFTGVLAAYRGRGVAMALKLRGASYAQREGYGRIVTWVESTNPAMVAVNTKLGFAPGLTTVWYERGIGDR